MKKLTPAAIALLRALAADGGYYSTHPSTRQALIDRGWMAQGKITEKGREALAELEKQG